MTYPFFCVNCWSKGSCYRRNSAGSLLATGATTNDRLLLELTRQQVTNGGDLLGEEGREALKACVKVQIRGRPETRRYEWNQAYKRLDSCFCGNDCDAVRRYTPPVKYPSPPWPNIQPTWADRERQVFLCRRDTVDIIDIHNALVSADEKRLVEVYPNEGPGSDELRCLIDQRRADIGFYFG